MHREELFDIVRGMTGLPEKHVRAIIEGALATIIDRLSDGENVELRRFGTFAIRERKATTWRNPRSGELVSFPPGARLAFRPAPSLRKRVGKVRVISRSGKVLKDIKASG